LRITSLLNNIIVVFVTIITIIFILLKFRCSGDDACRAEPLPAANDTTAATAAGCSQQQKCLHRFHGCHGAETVVAFRGGWFAFVCIIDVFVVVMLMRNIVKHRCFEQFADFRNCTRIDALSVTLPLLIQ
jgi:hypothetical protein